MLRQEIKQLKTGHKDLRRFGLLVGGVFLAIGVWLWWRHKAAFPYFLASGLLLMVCGLALPKALKWVYIAWMSLALVLGLMVSTLLLTVFFYFVVTPTGLIARLFGKDFLLRKRNPRAPSYWIPKEHSVATQKERYEQQF